MSVRLNKLLAQRGIGARRKCDALIQSGAVKVNGAVVREPGVQIEPERDRVEVKGRMLGPAPQLRYYALNKPVGVIATLDDPEGRPTVRELLPPGSRLFPVGRLDADTSGLLIVTNDGELAHRLMHPRYGVEKHYRVRVQPEPSESQLERLARGVEFEPGVVSAPARVRVADRDERGTMLVLTIHEGRYRQVRRMCEALGLDVLGLHRAGYGPLRLGPLPRGMWRELSEDEVARLRAASARPQPGRGPRLTRFDREQRRETARRASERRAERTKRGEETRSRPGAPMRPSRRPAPGQSRPRAAAAGRNFTRGVRPVRGERSTFGERAPARRARPVRDQRRTFGERGPARRERPVRGERRTSGERGPARRERPVRGERRTSGERGPARRERLVRGERRTFVERSSMRRERPARAEGMAGRESGRGSRERPDFDRGRPERPRGRAGAAFDRERGASRRSSGPPRRGPGRGTAGEFTRTSRRPGGSRPASRRPRGGSR